MFAPRIAGRTASIGALLAGETAGPLPWEADDIVYNLYYSLDSGKTWQPMASGLRATAHAYAWTLPDGGAGNAMVRVFQDPGSGWDADPRGANIPKSARTHLGDAPAGGTKILMSWKSGHPELHLSLERPSRVDVDGVDARGRVMLDWAVAHLEAGPHRISLPASLLPMATTIRIRVAGKARLPR